MISIFNLSGNKKDQETQRPKYNIQPYRPGETTNPYLNKNKNYSLQTNKLDEELTKEGVKIERLSDKEKWKYVNSLTDTEYNRLTQYRDAGYSF